MSSKNTVVDLRKELAGGRPRRCMVPLLFFCGDDNTESAVKQLCLNSIYIDSLHHFEPFPKWK